MADDIVLYRSIASRSYVAIWMLEELGLHYRMETVDIREGAQKSPGYLKLNPMGKVPTLTVNGAVVTEAPAICLFLADRYSYGVLAPKVDSLERGAYLRWSVFAAAVVEPAMLLHARNVDLPGRSVGWGSYSDMLSALRTALEGQDYVLGDRFTAADVIVGAAVGYGLFNKLLPDEPWLGAYDARIDARPARQRANALTWPPELFAPPKTG